LTLGLGARHTEALGVRSIDLLHVGMAISLEAKEFLTFDARQAGLAKAAGFRVRTASWCKPHFRRAFTRGIEHSATHRGKRRGACE
jgi:hypothetical protein